MGTNHDSTARRIARKNSTEYNAGQGPDVVSTRRAIEIETESTVKDGLRQLQGFKKPVYIAGANQAATKKALEATKGTTVGVMDPNGQDRQAFDAKSK
jgi:hypothetical protein